MPEAEQLILSASSNFIEICQAQTILLTRALGAVWSGVYLTVESQNSARQLLPVVIYPNAEKDSRSKKILARLTENWSQAEDNKGRDNNLERVADSLEGESNAATLPPTTKQTLTSQRQLKSFARRKQIVLPLMHEDEVIGLLVTKRDDRDWNRQEVSQIEEIAKTIAISCTLDRKQEYYRQRSEELQHSIVNEQNKTDDLLHQLRNPLTALRTFGKLLIKRLLPEDNNRNVVQNMLQQGDRIQDLLQQFQNNPHTDEAETTHLTLNTAPIYLGERIENSNFLLPANSFTTETIELQELLYPLIAAIEAIAQEKGIDFTVKIPNGLPAIQGNTRALREVFGNLLDNAIKYTPVGGSVEIEAGLSREKNNLHYQGIAIRDTGCGIPPQDLQHLFERNYRGVQAQSNIEGTGLGLSLAKDSIVKMQGEIEIISPNPLSNKSNSMGTIFTVWLLQHFPQQV
jgi:signal transduction histidine kinase